MAKAVEEIESTESTEEKTAVPGGIIHENPVTVTTHEAIGTLFLGLVSLVLLVALLRSEAARRRLLEQQLAEAE